MVQEIFLDFSEVQFDVLCKCNYILNNTNHVRQYELQKIIEAKNTNPYLKNLVMQKEHPYFADFLGQ